MPNTLIVGSSPDCDAALAVPSVSGRHCRLTREGGVVFLEDLGSRNGTYVNGARVEGGGRVPVSPADAIHLGSHRLDLEAVLARLVVDRAVEGPIVLDFAGDELVIGRAPECGLALDLATVSSRHARLSRDGTAVVVEDLGSSNGTYVDGRRISTPTVLGPDSVLSLGSSPFRLSAGSFRSALPAGEVPSFEWRERPDSTAALPGVALFGASLAAALAPLAVPAGPARLFAMAVAATALGAVDALAASMWRPNATGRRSAVAVALLCLVQAQFLGLVGRRSGGLDGGIAVLSLAALAGAAAGSLAIRLTPGPLPARAGAIAGLAVAAGLLGGFAPVASDVPAALRPVLGLSPVRWAFEGLMLAGPTGAAGDPVERYFPAATDRMGLPADCAALAFLAVGLGAAATARRPAAAGADYPTFLTA